jgi:OmcA/MtrC family decaheme c-type cytochrome
MPRHNAWRAVCVLLALCSFDCGDSDGAAGKPGSNCTVSKMSDGAVVIRCDDGTKETIRPPSIGELDAGACTVEQTSDAVTITCPDGSSATLPLPTGQGSDAGTCTVEQGDGGAVTITCPGGDPVTIPGATPTPPASGTIIVGATQAACGACHDTAPARAHFKAMTVEVDGKLQETCGTCHNETSIEPVTKVHARPEFAAPGLKAAIGAVTIDGTTRLATARITLTDASNAPVARTGLSFQLTLGRVAAITHAAYEGLPSPPVVEPLAGPYLSYIMRTVTQVAVPDFPLATPPRTSAQATTERGDGTWTEISTGVYDYTFKFAIPAADYDPNLTHVLALYVTHTLDGVRFVANAEKFFVPADGSATPLVREAVSGAACNGCHNPLSAHGGSRQDLQLCLTCHTQGSTDPESGNSIDFNVMIHRIHRGKGLPSVVAGTPYKIVGNSSSIHDFSKVGFPQDIRNCTTCHDTPDDRWVTNGTQAACTSCHDDILNPGRHIGTLSPQTTCGNSNCHAPGGIAPDAQEAHVTALQNSVPGVFEIDNLSISVASADEAPVVRFRARTGSVSTGAITPLTDPNLLPTLTAFFNGPNTSYASSGKNITLMPKAQLLDLAADQASAGEFTFRLPKTLRELSAGHGEAEIDSYTLSLRAAYDPTPEAAGADRVDMARNPSKEFGVGEEVVARVPVVSTDKCNSCHSDLRAHGGDNLARNVEQCAMCHTAKMDTQGRQGGNKEAGPTTSLRFSTLVHRLHAGGYAEQPYTVYGFSAMPPYPKVDLSDIVFPGAMQVCTTCHVGNTYQLPLPQSTAPSEYVTLDENGEVVVP